jgi:hypothetical protein
MERCIYFHIYDITKDLLDSSQHGFRSNRSTTSQLIEFYSTVQENLDNGKQTDVLYLDLKKAFDKVPHNLLIHKLGMFGFNGHLLGWIENYLTNRYQRVVINGIHSNYIKVSSGVPQGSILGPLLFIYYINDLGKFINPECQISLYADDSKISCCIEDYNDCYKLQNSLHGVIKWSKLWGMVFNINKCNIMSINRNRNTIVYDYIADNINLKRVTSMLDLGLTITSTLNWEPHIKKITAKASQRLGIVKRCIGLNVNPDIKLLAYKALVRPLLEYCSQIWSHNNKKSTLLIERVQRRATYFITNQYDINYKERLLLCNLLPLTMRREFLDLTCFYNIKNGLIDLNIRSIFKCNDHELPKRIFCKTEQYFKFFPCRIFNMWNFIPEDIRNTELTLNGKNIAFKKLLKLWFYDYYEQNFNCDNTCTWVLRCRCANCRIY